MAVDPTPVLWDRILDEVQRRLPTSQAFETWFQPLRPRVVSDASLELDANGAAVLGREAEDVRRFHRTRLAP